MLFILNCIINYLRLYLVVGYLLRFGSLLCVAQTFLVELHIDGVLQVLYAGLVVEHSVPVVQNGLLNNTVYLWSRMVY